MRTVTLDELGKAPEKHGFRFIPCDKCGGSYYAADFEPTECFGCMPCNPPDETGKAKE